MLPPPSMTRILHLIDGELAEPVSGDWLDNFEPATGLAYSLVPDGDERDVERAVDAAERAFPAWSTTPADTRSRWLLRLAQAVEDDSETLARAESVDNGKPLALARSVDIPRAVANLRFFATAILHSRSEFHATDHEALNYTLRRPRGVAGCISPWNLPLYLFTWKIAPALATGNTVVAKPSEITPMTAFLLSKMSLEAGLPAGVLNVVHGLGAKVGAAIVRHPRVGTITFTGGTTTGAEIARSAGPLFKKLSLELGGKNPNLVFADADLDQAVPASLRAAFSNQGQICLAGSRIFVEQSSFAAFLERFVAAARRLRIGDPLAADTEQGALVSRAHCEKVLSYIEMARSEGARVLCGGAATVRSSRALPERVVRGADRHHGSAGRLAGELRGDLRARGDRHPVPHRGPGHRMVQRHAVRLVCLALDAGSRSRAPCGRTTGIGNRLDQLLDAPRPSCSLRWNEGERSRSRGGRGGAAVLHRVEERLPPDFARGTRRVAR